jgi:CheY-like chemotaxis protein
MLGRLFEAKGHACTEARDGQECLRLFDDNRLNEDHPFDAILMDRSMPGMDGAQAAVELRQRGYRGCIIGITGDASTADIDDYMSFGVDAVFIKPVNADEIEFEIGRLIVERAAIEQSIMSI